MTDRPWTLATSSYRAYQPKWGAAVRISLMQPKWFPTEQISGYPFNAAPRWSYFKKPPEEFAAEYLAQLNAAGVDHFLQKFDAIYTESFNPNTGELPPRLVLLCWEVDGSPESCHRGQFARWWEEQTGEHIPELGGRDFTQEALL